jgi:hypothetical protein
MGVCLDFATVKVRVSLHGNEGCVGLIAANKVMQVIQENCQPVPETLHMQVELWRWNPDNREHDFLVNVFAEEELVQRIEWIKELLMGTGAREKLH